ncbi:MAG: hypothetical protein HFJ89_09095 [Oscillospiraceae bacterium]|nr:hypothetical protein [Oscillospiraceae bacterium]
MNDYMFFAFEPATIVVSIVNIALLGGIIFLVIDLLRKKYGKKHKDKK